MPPPYRMIINALRANGTVLHLNKKYLSNVQIPRTCIQKRLLYTINREITPIKYIFWDAKILTIIRKRIFII